MTANDFKTVIKTPSCYKVDDKWIDDRFQKVRIAVMHSGENLNHSSFSTDVIRKAKESFKNIPILANVVSYTDENNVEHLDFGGHDAYIEEDKFNEGQYRMIYLEKVVGIVPETNNFEIVYDDESGKDFAYVDALLYKEYSNYVTDILEARGGSVSVSAEVLTDVISYDASREVVVVEEMRMSGITLLGADTPPAMKGANAQVFSINKEDLQSQMIKLMSELKDSLDRIYNAANTGETSEKGGNHNVKFEELLEQYGITAEDVTFEYDGLSDEELEAVFAEHFTQPEEDPAGAAEPEAAEEDGAADNEDETGDEGEDEAEKEFESAEDETIEHPEDGESVHMSVSYKDKVTEFSVSLKDKLQALYVLVNDTYADDCTWYDVDVYDEDKYLIMIDISSNKGYKQSYKVKKDVYTLVGDRVEVFAQWLTADQISALDRMKSEYAEATEKLNHYEEEPKKMEILSSEDYSLIADNEAFVDLMKPENHFSLSIDEVTQKADSILTEAAKKRQFSVENHNQGVKPFATSSKKEKRFGSLFDGII